MRIGPSKIPLQVQSFNISPKDPQSYPTFQNSRGKLPELGTPNEIPEYPPQLPVILHTNDPYCHDYVSPDGRQIGRVPNAISKLLSSTGNDVSIRHNVYPSLPSVHYRPPVPVPRNPWCESNNGIHLTMPFPNTFTNVTEITNDVKVVNSDKVEYPRSCQVPCFSYPPITGNISKSNIPPKEKLTANDQSTVIMPALSNNDRYTLS